MYAIFSETGRFIGYADFKPQAGTYKELPLDFNPVEKVYVGDYESGSVKTIQELKAVEYREANVDKKWVVYEKDLNTETRKNIEEVNSYEMYKQLNLIMQALYDNKDKLTLSKDFTHMFEVIDDLRHRHSISIESYKKMSEAGKIHYVPIEQEGEFLDKYTEKVLNIKE
jgi:hypothetical protein